MNPVPLAPIIGLALVWLWFFSRLLWNAPIQKVLEQLKPLVLTTSLFNATVGVYALTVFFETDSWLPKTFQAILVLLNFGLAAYNFHRWSRWDEQLEGRLSQ